MGRRARGDRRAGAGRGGGGTGGVRRVVAHLARRAGAPARRPRARRSSPVATSSCRSSSRRPAAPRRSARRCRSRRPRSDSSATRVGAHEPTVLPAATAGDAVHAARARWSHQCDRAARSPSASSRASRPTTSRSSTWSARSAPALAMGNTVIVRPAGQDPLAVVELVKLLEDVGFPPGVVNIVTGSTPESGEALVESPDVDMVSFTGSTAVGVPHRRGRGPGDEAPAARARRQGRGARARRRRREERRSG